MSATGKGFQVEYRSITLHAISRADNKPSIYCQLDENIAEGLADGDEEAAEMRELIIIPQVAESRAYRIVSSAHTN